MPKKKYWVFWEVNESINQDFAFEEFYGASIDNTHEKLKLPSGMAWKQKRSHGRKVSIAWKGRNRFRKSWLLNQTWANKVGFKISGNERDASISAMEDTEGNINLQAEPLKWLS